MRILAFIFIVMLSVVSCKNSAESLEYEDSAVVFDYVDNMDDEMDQTWLAGALPDSTIAVIVERKERFLEVSDTEFNFYFSDDEQLQYLDPHAYWLMNRMMQMVQYVKTAEDAWGWMMAMNCCVKEYNLRLERHTGSLKAALLAIEELIDMYCTSANQGMMNTASYVLMIVSHYRTLYNYAELMEWLSYDEDNTYLMNLYYREFKEWFDLNNAQNAIMTFYTEGGSYHSALHMEMGEKFALWQDKRSAELLVETQLCYWESDESYKSNADFISVGKFDRLLKYFKGITEEEVVRQKLADVYDEDDARAIAIERYDYQKIAEMVSYYDTAIRNWREVREQIAMALPKQIRKSYRQITCQMHTRLYNDLYDLKNINY